MKLGLYEVGDELGRGGAGAVYRGRAPDGREVAVKLLHRGSEDAQAFGRFERERRLLASLGESEGFVPLLDSGHVREGLFLVMPFVSGGTLRDKLCRGPLGIDATLALGTKLARALGRAHQRGIVHRDLKPENVLFSPGASGSGEELPLVADLGLAKHFRADSPGASQSVQLSQKGELRGTAGYMPREQMRDAQAAGPPADVFALGAILVECLTGEPLWGGENLIEVLGRVEDGLPKPVRTLAPAAPAWLAAVLERCLAPEPAARFPDAAALALALEAGPARAPGSPVARVFVALAFLAFVVAAAAVWLATRHPGPSARPPAGDSPTPSPTSSPPPSIAPSAGATSRPASPAPTPTLSPLPELTARFARTAATRLVSVWGRYEWSHAGNISDVRVLPDGKRAVSTAADGCLKLWEIATGAELSSVAAHEGAALAVAVSPDGRRAVTGGSDAALRIWDLATGGCVASVGSAQDESVNAVAFSHDGRGVLSGGHGDRRVRLWNVEDLARGDRTPAVELLLERGGTSSVAFLPDDLRAVSTGSDGKLHLWTLATGEEVRDFTRNTENIGCSAIAPDGRSALASGHDGKIRLWDFETGALVRTLEGHQGAVVALACSPDGRRALSGGVDRVLRLWDVASGQTIAKLAGHARTVKSLAFAPDGLTALSAGTDHSIRVWDLAAAVRGEPCEREARGGHQGGVHGVAFVESGARAVTAGFDETLRLWEVASGREEKAFAGTFPVRWLALAPDGERAILGGGAKGALLSFDLASWKPGLPLRGPVAAPTAAIVLADGRRTLAGFDDGNLRLWDLAEAKREGSLPSRRGAVTALARLPDGRVLSAARGEALRLEDPASAASATPASEPSKLAGALATLGGAPGPSVVALAVTADGALVAAADERGSIDLVSFPDGAALDRIDLAPSSDRALALALDARGRTLLVGTSRGLVLRFALERP